MSKQSYYEQLGVTETASFEEIQAARVKLAKDFADDPQRLQAVEQAYDALLMERLRLRQEGKIQVPDGVRFAENKVPAKPPSNNPSFSLPQWSSGFADRPQLWDWLAPTITYLVLAGLTVAAPGQGAQGLQAWMAIATGSALFFVYRKQNRVLRAIGFSFGGLIAGFLIGMPLVKAILPMINSPFTPAMSGAIGVSWITFLILWVISCFVK
jgi:hypothetical protein